MAQQMIGASEVRVEISHDKIKGSRRLFLRFNGCNFYGSFISMELHIWFELSCADPTSP